MKPALLIGKDTHQELALLLQKEGDLVISGASNDTAKSLLLTHLLSFQHLPTLLVTDDEHLSTMKHWLAFFGEDVRELHPSPLQEFLRFMDGEQGVFILTRSLWNTPFPSFWELKKRKLTVHVGQKLPFTPFIEELLIRGYEHMEDVHLEPRQYRRVGDALEIFPTQSSHSIKITFEFDRVERIMVGGRRDGENGDKDAIDIFPAEFTESCSLKEQLPERTLLVLDDQDEIIPSHKPLLRFTVFPETQKHHVHVRYLSVLKFYTLTDFLNDLREKIDQEWRLVVVSRRGEELLKIFKEEHIPHTVGSEERHNAVMVVCAEEVDLLPHSLQNPDLHCALLTDREIFSLKKLQKQRSVQKLALDFLTSLSPGDYVVHMEHGVGRFEGVTSKVVDDTCREYLELTYAEGDKLFTPVDQADKLSKFVHEEGKEPVLTRLGTTEWKRVTEKIAQETEKVAKELLDLYAKRAAAKRKHYQEDNPQQKTFEENFPYQETVGQLKAIEDIKQDMDSPHPMDRLVCGDVGFGKTEVAMRAAFKAVQDGRKVAVIAPITILADQHYHTFRERMKGFPVRIEMLSRFCTPKEQRETLERLRKGQVDIIIGTHRLLQNDVVFFNLGLVVVDEEQRFGVKQKERFKDLRASVDVLTLSATPIPRTLNLGLHKLRDITTITTPPPGRLPIITEVRKYSDVLTREAILFELKRKGQCFVLHNRVETIDAFANKLQSLVPEARFVVGHGQLKSEDLEGRILLFKKGECDVLVSSTIIENGIDLPRANTLIVNEAERFGLAQLYQLRGRVGRSTVQAHAYFLYHSQKLSDDAKKRLRAVTEACELGSGFQIAMRDLEIRGAGEILGVSQSGALQTVGVSHYLRMLKRAVDELQAGKKDTFEEVENVEILLPLEALLPSFFVPDEEERISMYQKLAASEDEVILKEFAEDLLTEYGKFPKQVQHLFEILRLKMACRRAGVSRVKGEEVGKGDREIVLTLSKGVTAKEIMQLLGRNSQWRISSNTLRIHEEELKKRAGSGEYLSELTEEVKMLQRKGERFLPKAM